MVLAMDGCLPAAVATCLVRMNSNPERVMARPEALWKEFRVAILTADGEPSFDCSGCFFPQWQYPLASPFPHYVNGGDRLLIKLVHSKRDQLGDAQPRSKGQVQHRPVTDPRDCVRVRSVEKR